MHWPVLRHSSQRPAVTPDTEKLFLLRKWSLAGKHPGQGPLRSRPSHRKMASRRPVPALAAGPVRRCVLPAVPAPGKGQARTEGCRQARLSVPLPSAWARGRAAPGRTPEASVAAESRFPAAGRVLGSTAFCEHTTLGGPPHP